MGDSRHPRAQFSLRGLTTAAAAQPAEARAADGEVSPLGVLMPRPSSTQFRDNYSSSLNNIVNLRTILFVSVELET